MNTSVIIGTQDTFAARSKTPTLAWFSPANFLMQEANGLFIHGRSGTGKTTQILDHYGKLVCHLWENFGIYCPIFHVASTAPDAWKFNRLLNEYTVSVEPSTGEHIKIHPADQMTKEIWMPKWDAGLDPPSWIDRTVEWMPPMMNLKVEMDIARLQLDTQYAFWLEKWESEFWEIRKRHSPYTAEYRTTFFQEVFKRDAKLFSIDPRMDKDIGGRILPMLRAVRKMFTGQWAEFERLFSRPKRRHRVPFLQLNLCNSTDIALKFAYLNGFLSAIFNHGWKWTHGPDIYKNMYLVIVIDDINEYCPQGYQEESYREHLKTTVLDIARKGRRFFMRGAIANMPSTVHVDFRQETTVDMMCDYGYQILAVDRLHKVRGVPYSMRYRTETLIFDPTPSSMQGMNLTVRPE